MYSWKGNLTHFTLKQRTNQKLRSVTPSPLDTSASLSGGVVPVGSFSPNVYSGAVDSGTNAAAVHFPGFNVGINSSNNIMQIATGIVSSVNQERNVPY